ncbi:hypothetical protein VTK26DRAFT_3586 [Humicola hyalothermophila]
MPVRFEWLLNTVHGADYFRRWHRDRRNSGGLLVHKATHHFDLVNFWLQTRPVSVHAQGGLRFYGKENAEERGVTRFYSRTRGSAAAEGDPFALDLEKVETLKRLYLDAEHEDGYYRDQSVFGDGISIEDTMNVLVRYRNGAVMTYSLTAYAPWEGFRSLEGCIERRSIWLQPLFEPPKEIEIEDGKGAHGGGDSVLLQDLFGEPVSDEYMRAASHINGAASILTGIAANKSIATGQVVFVDDILKVPG